MLHLGQRTLEEAHRCGYLLAEAKRTAHWRDGGFRGVCERAGIPKTTAYRLVELYRRHPEVSQLGHFDSVTAALDAGTAAPTGKAAELDALLERLKEAAAVRAEEIAALDTKIESGTRRVADLLADNAAAAAAGDTTSAKRLSCYAEVTRAHFEIADLKQGVASAMTRYEGARRRLKATDKLLKQHGIDVHDPDVWMRRERSA